MFDWSDMDKFIGRVEGIVQKHIDKEANDLERRIANTKLTSILREVDTCLLYTSPSPRDDT